MITEAPKQLPGNISMDCYACTEETATHVCKYKVGELSIQVCLCEKCMQMDTQRLLKKIIGIQEVSNPEIDSFLPSKQAMVMAS